MKTFEKYCADAVSPPDDRPNPESLSGAERAFLEKYLGADWRTTLAGKGLDRPVDARSVKVLETPGGTLPDGGPARTPAEDPDGDLEARLMNEEELRLVGFRVRDQLYAAPIAMVQEVLRAVPSITLPGAPDFMAGVTNLRGRVTPLVNLARLLDLDDGDRTADDFLIVCRLKGLQVGLAVRAIDTLYRAPRRDIEWGIEAQVGVCADLLAGLLKVDDRLIKILSINRLFQRVLKS